MPEQAIVFIGLGSNLGDRQDNLYKAVLALKTEVGQILETSSLYQTAPWGKKDQPAFLNQVVKLRTRLSPAALMEGLLVIEMKMGRKRVEGETMGPRIIDLDILFYEKKVVDEPHLQIPHPRLEKRNFVLAPLLELAPDWVHPVSGRTVKELYRECADTGEVTRLGR